jgi:hypothetical protein
MSKTLKTDNNTANRVYSGPYTGEETADNPLAELMKPSGDQKRVTYDEGLRWDEGTKYGLNVEKADRVRFNAENLRTKTHGKNPGDDDQAKGSI